jgi:hypothetical protein
MIIFFSEVDLPLNNNASLDCIKKTKELEHFLENHAYEEKSIADCQLDNPACENVSLWHET